MNGPVIVILEYLGINCIVKMSQTMIEFHKACKVLHILYRKVELLSGNDD